MDTEVQQWREILTEIYTYLCVTDAGIRSTLIQSGPRPFTVECKSPWGLDREYPATTTTTPPHRCLISDVLVDVRVAASSDKLKACTWLGTLEHRLRRAVLGGRLILSLWKRPLYIIRSFSVFRSVSGRGFYNN